MSARPMRDSGGGILTNKEGDISWLGNTPLHWQIVPSKQLFTESVLRTQHGDEQLSATQRFGVILQKEYEELIGRRVVQSFLHQEKRKHVEIDDFVISMRSFQGGIERSKARGCIRSSYIILKPSERVDVDFFQYLFKSDIYIKALQITSNFIRDGQDLNWRNFTAVRLPVIPLQEQRAIATFLDRKTSQIDQIIEKKERLIKLLEEKRSALITQAVTRGLDPDVPMKDSGVEWIGEIPAHWELKKIKHFADTHSGTTPSSGKFNDYYQDGTIPWIRTTDLNNDEMHSAPINITEVALKETSCRLLPKDTVLIAMYGGSGTIGKNAIIKFASTVNQAVCAVVCNGSMNPVYFHDYIQYYRPFFMIFAVGTRKDPNISQDIIKETLVLSPPLSEQRAIATFLDEKTSQIDQIIAKSKAQIEKLKEYRQALITSAVTGKIDLSEQGATHTATTSEQLSLF